MVAHAVVDQVVYVAGSVQIQACGVQTTVVIVLVAAAVYVGVVLFSVVVVLQ